MHYVNKLKEIAPFVRLGINIRRKRFTAQEKRLISYYHNKLSDLGYFDSIQAGYKYLNISKAPKAAIKGAPRLYKIPVKVGTILVNGRVETDPKANPRIKDGKVYVFKDGTPDKWFFTYNIAKNWNEEDFKKHILKQIGKKNLRKTQLFAIGAGVKYEVGQKGGKERGTLNDSLTETARNILKIGFRYTNNLTEPYEDRNQVKYLKDWMQQITVYEYVEGYSTEKPKKLRKKRKTAKRGASRGKRNSNN